MIEFTKLHGLGNDFIVMRSPDGPHPDREALARTLCDRRFGVGGDGLIFIEPSDQAPYLMRMLNPDGSESGMCGNGLRCVVRYLESEGPDFKIVSGDRVVEACMLENGDIRVDMGVYRLEDLSLTVDGLTGVNVWMGNPHYIVFIDDVDAVELESIGPRLETNPAFPDRTNVHFAEIQSRHQVKQRTWERGAGITLACGSGACAGAVAAYRRGLTDADVDMQVPGGILHIAIDDADRVFMTGPAVKVFDGVWPG